MGRPGRRRRGGIHGLVGLLSEHGEAIEADFQRYYHCRITDCSLRRFAALVKHLPPEAALWRAMGEFTLTEHLLARAAGVVLGQVEEAPAQTEAERDNVLARLRATRPEGSTIGD